MSKKSALEIIQEYYGDKRAKRSGVPYINHIYEGLSVLKYLNADKETKDAYCLHPIFQDDDSLEDNIIWLEVCNYKIQQKTLLYVMEYRNVANRGLSCYQVDNPDKIYLGPLNPIKQMLIADKVQNRKDFLKYHLGSHPKSQELDIYFKNWLRKLEITEYTYNKLCEVINNDIQTT